MREERIEFLGKLGALRREPASARELLPAPGRHPRPRTAIVNRAALRYRLLFTKIGKARFLSHLDIVRLLPRVFRRASLPMTYSLGFRPSPRITFAPALPLGWGSRGEVLDIHLEERTDGTEIIDRLNGATPEGIEFLEARSLEEADARLPRVIQAAEYVVDLPPDADSGSLEAGLERISSMAPVLIARRKGISADPLDASGAILAAFLEGPGRVRLVLRLDAAPAVRPDDLGAWLCGRSVAARAIERRALWRARAGTPRRLSMEMLSGGALVSPLDLEALRREEKAN
jgi:radical SAM-linked protein